jgi:peptide/nickel transport system substrate-binding protein
MKKSQFLVPLFVMIGLLTLACGAPSVGAPAATAVPKVMTIAIDLAPSSLDPHVDNATVKTNIDRHMFSLLVRRNNKLELEGDLAESWKNIDPLTWEFKLRKGVKWHDGTDVTAQDVKFSFDRMIDPKLNLKQRSFIATVAKTEIVDASTVRLITTAPDPLLPNRLTFGCFILPEKYLNSIGADAFGKKPMGSGPYKFVEWVPNQQVVMEAFKDYWEGTPKIDKLIWKSVPEVSTRVSALKTGEADLINKLPVQELTNVRNDPKLAVANVPSNRIAFFGFNTFQPPFQGNVKLRQALNYATDVDLLIKGVLGGSGVPTLLGTNLIFGVDPSIKPYPYDPEKAKQLLTEAGFPNGLEIAVDSATQGSTPNDTELVQAACGQWAKVNVKCNIKTAEFGAYVTSWLAKGPKGVYLFSFGGPILDLDALMASHFDSTRRALYYNRPDLDAMIKEAATTFDSNKRIDLYKKISQLIKDDAPWVFLFAADEIYGVNKKVQGYVPRADEAIWLFPASIQ